MLSPWLAIDGTTPPAQHARTLRRAWEQFLDRGDAAAVRRPIAESWRRSYAAGIDPTGQRPCASADSADEAAALWEVHPLAGMAPLIRECLAGMDADHLLVVSDGEGRLLWIDGEPSLRLAAAESMNFAEGAVWSESGAGTNAVGTALAADHAVQVFAAEHFSEVVQAWTCSAAPIHDPVTGRALGVIDLTSRFGAVHRNHLAVARATAAAIEAELRCRRRERDALLCARHASGLVRGAGAGALVDASGRVIADHPPGASAPARSWHPSSRARRSWPPAIGPWSRPSHPTPMSSACSGGARRRGVPSC